MGRMPARLPGDFQSSLRVKERFNLDQFRHEHYLLTMKGDEVWSEAEKAFAKNRHKAAPMLQVSRGALYSYCCPFCAEQGYPLLFYSVTSSILTCDGGTSLA